MHTNIINKTYRLILNNKKFINNSVWIIVEKLISIFGLIFITSYVAKYIGPENFGKLSYAISIFTIIQTISMLGTDTILFKRISKNKTSGIKLMLSTTKIRVILYGFISIAYITYSIYSTKDFITIIFTISVALAYLFLSIDHFSIFYNAILASKINVLFNIIGLIISLCIRYSIVFFELNIAYLSIPILLTTFIPYLLRYIFFYYTYNEIKKIKRNKNVYNSYLIKAGFPISISNISIAIYAKVSQILLVTIISNYILGIFSVAYSLAYAWLFIPQAIITSYFTKIYKLKTSSDIITYTSYLNIFIGVISIFYLFFIYYLGDIIIFNLYGYEYMESSTILFPLAITSVFSCLGIISYRYIIAFSGYSFLLKKMFITSILGVTLSYILIKDYGLKGAVISNLSIEFISLTILNYFFRKKLVQKMHFRTLFFFLPRHKK
ncbi:oligosaccharide flippase family protein [Proteus mirabilis]|uniref:oligosaccharide flippase family protein n=1 Tax=Proteus mirabilis TaxID=584 RepID=UPI002025AFBA|nr:oligosaccharide flippase family protein [Proteus mirabilis]MCL8609228.1 oligosaccharide flippase family protein [Proteus mirabilis]MCT0124403.1 oligosaccharide flippase family protein [Proteus mirabilis]MDF7337828.1 oligosaccharide flippase family protein [Proteus mirabilis]